MMAGQPRLELSHNLVGTHPHSHTKVLQRKEKALSTPVTGLASLTSIFFATQTLE